MVYAGNASLECPLTDDFAFFATQLRNVSRASVTLGGTRIADAVRFAAQTAFDDASPSARELVLISAGGDESQNTSEALSELAAKSIHFRVVGIGDGTSGGIVPGVLYQGKPVVTKLKTVSLQKLCQPTARCTYSENSITPVDEPALVRPMGTSSIALLLALAAAALLAWNRKAATAGLTIFLLCGFADPAWRSGDFLSAAESFAESREGNRQTRRRRSMMRRSRTIETAGRRKPSVISILPNAARTVKSWNDATYCGRTSRFAAGKPRA